MLQLLWIESGGLGLSKNRKGNVTRPEVSEASKMLMQITFQLTFQQDSELNTSFPVACGGSTHICTCNGADMGVSWEKYTGCRQAMILFSIVKPCDVERTSWFSYIALQSNVFFCHPIARVASNNVITTWTAINQNSGIFCVGIQ